MDAAFDLLPADRVSACLMAVASAIDDALEETSFRGRIAEAFPP
jgi:hypothetical protein